jgi:hypothetical protein
VELAGVGGLHAAFLNESRTRGCWWCREEILEAAARLLNRQPLEEVSTNHIAQKTGISIGTLYKYYPNKDSILADLSLMYMQKDAELVGAIFDKYRSRSLPSRTGPLDGTREIGRPRVCRRKKVSMSCCIPKGSMS